MPGWYLAQPDKVVRTVSVLLFCVPLAACTTTTTTLYGNQSTSGGTTTTTTSGQVSGSTQGANYKVSFSSGGQPASPRASGGYVAASGNAAYVLVGVVALAELWNYYFRGGPQAKPLPPGTAISDTCSCYKQDSDK